MALKASGRRLQLELLSASDITGRLFRLMAKLDYNGRAEEKSYYLLSRTFGGVVAMIVETLERQQRQDLKDIRRLSKTDYDRAAKEARERLISAKIIGSDGKLAKPYK
jgi:hypothetical protein